MRGYLEFKLNRTLWPATRVMACLSDANGEKRWELSSIEVYYKYVLDNTALIAEREHLLMKAIFLWNEASGDTTPMIRDLAREMLEDAL